MDIPGYDQSRFALSYAPIWDAGVHRFVLCRPIIMGILNATPDSFSDGGQHQGCKAAMDFAMQMVSQGADIIDVGGESTRPGAKPVTIDEELSRVLPVVRELVSRGICVSIDTYHPEVAAECVKAGVSIINDISGFSDPRMVELAAGSDVGVIAMHMLGTPKDMQSDPRYDDVVGEIRCYLADAAARLEASGVAPSRICVDPGPGFGKNMLHNLQIMSHMDGFATLGYPLIAAFSRKGTLGRITGVDEASQRIISSATAAAISYCGGARIFRVHDVAQTVEALQVICNAAYAGSHPLEGVSTMLPGKRALVALGSNMPTDMGDSAESIIAATSCIDAIPGTRVIASSSIYSTEPAYYDAQDNFANSVVWVQTTLEPNELLQELFKVENDFHRVRKFANGPRTLDLDVIDYEGVVSDDPQLILPHPRVLERDFTVTPIKELAKAMESSFGIYVDPGTIEDVGCKDPSISGGFRLADGREVTDDGVTYGKVVAKLRDASEAITRK